MDIKRDNPVKVDLARARQRILGKMCLCCIGQMDQAMRVGKHVAVAVFLPLILAGGVSAQGWFPIGATWTYNYADQLFTGYVTHVVTGDSVLDGQSCRVIDVTRTYGLGSNVYILHLDPYCVYESDGLAFIHVPGIGFDTLYNMNAAIGDRWNLASLPEQCDSTSYLEVVDDGVAAIDGVQMHWLAVDIHFPELNWVFQDTIIERIGTLVSYFPPQNFCLGAVDGSEGGSLRCYQDGEINFQATWAEECEISLGLNEQHKADVALEPYPNPGSGFLQLNWPGNRTFDLIVQDAMGRTLYRNRVLEETGTVDLSPIPNGLYFLLVTAPDGTRASAKWIKQ